MEKAMKVSNKVSAQSPVLPAENLWFDYNDVSTPVARFLRGQADRIRRSVGKSVIDVGKDLIAAKHHLSHGTFLVWVETAVGLPRRTAQAYMQVAHWASNKRATVALLPPTLLYLLSAPSTPTDFIVNVLKRVESGEHIPPRTIRDELKALREAKQNENEIASLPVIKLGAHHREMQTIDEGDEGQFTVLAAVEIMARGLPPSDFARLREIMTSQALLGDPRLPDNIEAAFLAAGDIIEPVSTPRMVTTAHLPMLSSRPVSQQDGCEPEARV
jgi:hypothetical protein